MHKVMIISPHREARQRLQLLAEYTDGFETVVALHDTAEVQDRVSDHWDFDYVFLSRQFRDAEIAALIEAIRRIPKGNDTSFILIGHSNTESAKAVADGMVAGIHGFLCEPFSMEAVQEACRLAENVRRQTTGVRLRAATGLMLTGVASELDGQDASSISLWDRVQQTCEAYKQVTGESITSAVVSLQKLAQTERIGSYNGVSKRVRELFKARLMRKIDSATAKRPRQGN